MRIEDSLSAKTIEIVDEMENAEAVIARLSERLAPVLGIDRDEIQSAVLAREKTRSTAFTNGAAIPHCRLSQLERFGIGIMILRRRLRWDQEGHTVDTVMMIAGPSKNIPEHLRILANSSQLLESAALRSKLKEAPSAAAALGLMIAAERAIEERRSSEGVLRELHKDPANGTDYLSELVSNFKW